MTIATRIALFAVALSLVAAGGVSAASAAPASAPHGTLVVATNGNDSAVGSVSAPLATVQAAISRLPQGGTVEVRGGRYFQRISLVGTRNLTVRPYAHEHVILDGSHSVPPQGFSAMVLVQNASYVQVAGFEITAYRTTSMAATPIGIYVHGHDDHISINGNHVHDLGNYNTTQGSYDFNAHGIAAYGDDPAAAISQLAISGNEVDHLTLGASESVVVNGNVDGWAITGNQVHDNNNIGIDAIGFEPTLPAKYRYTDLNRARNGIIANNTVSRIRSEGNPTYYADGGYCNCADGIYVDGGTHILVKQNTATANDIGIEIAAENARGSADHVQVLANTITLSRYVGIATGGYCDGNEDCGGVNTGTSTDNDFIGNTLAGNNQLNDGSPEVLIQYYTSNDRFLRNRITAENSVGAIYGSALRSSTDGISGHNTSDFNAFTVIGQPQIPFTWLATPYATFAAYRQATAQDAHSTFTVRNHS
jgi:hypothetical protein